MRSSSTCSTEGRDIWSVDADAPVLAAIR